MSLFYMDKQSVSRLVYNIKSKFISDVSLSEGSLVFTRGDGTTKTIQLGSSEEATMESVESILEGLD